MINKKILVLLVLLFSYPLVSNWEHDPVFEENSSLSTIYFHNEFIFSSSFDGYNYRYSNVDEAWERLNIGIEGVGRFWEYYSYSDSLFGTYEDGIIVSVDNGESWVEYKKYENLIKFLTFGKNDEYLFSAWSSGLRRAKSNDYIFDEIETPKKISIHSISVSGNKLSLVERRSSNGFGGGLFLSPDNGDNWESFFINTKIMNAEVKGDTVYTILSSNLKVSLDFGVTWNTYDLKDEYGYMIHLDSYLYLLSFDGEFARFNLETFQLENLANEFKNQIITCHGIHEKNGKLYIVTSNGMYIYNPKSEELTNNSPLKKGGLTFTITKSNDDGLLATSYTAGTFIKKEVADEWEQYSQELDDWSKSILRVHYLDGNPYFLDYYRKKYFYEKVEGEWQEISLVNGTSGFGAGLIDGRFYYNDIQSIYYTSNDGETWENIIGPLDEESGNNWWVDCMSVFDDEIYGGTRNGIYHYSIDEQSWTKMTVLDSPADSGVVSRFYQDEDNLFALIDANGHKLFEFDEEQNVWNKKVEFDSTNIYPLYWYNDTFFWKSGDKLWMTNDGGKTEIDISDGLNANFLMYIQYINIIDGYLYITGSDGVYKRPITDYGLTNVSEVVEARNYLFTYPPYPNPANNSINVKFYWDISLPMEVSDINIYDLSGNKLNVEGNLTINKQEQYYGNLVWDCSEVPAGIYIINIKHGTEEKAVKVVVE